mgnify:CR=1 FL=1
MLLALVARLWVSGYKAAQRMAVVIACVLLVQVCLGISNVLFALPLAVAVAHNAVGALLLLVMVTVVHRVFTVDLKC